MIRFTVIKTKQNTLSTVERMDWQGVRMEEERTSWRLSPVPRDSMA